jgi:hypothetical protein
MQTCPTTDPCLPVCPAAFERVVISYITKGSTRVLWSLFPTFTDPGPLEFQLQVGTTANPNADDWADVGLPVTDQYFAVDPEQRVWGMLQWTHYRVKLTTTRGVYYSVPTGGLGTLDRRAWLVARERLRQRLVAYRVGFGAQRGFLLKRRVTGQPCPTCTDYQTNQSRDPDCPDCYGTGKKCGYYYPIGCTWAEIDPTTYHVALDPQGQMGTVNNVVVRSEMVMTEVLVEHDLFIVQETDLRYFIHDVQHTCEVRGVPVIAKVTLRPIPYSSSLYDIVIPGQVLAAMEAA